MSLSVIIPVYGRWQPERVISAVAPLDPLEILVADSSPTPTALPEHLPARLIHLPERAYPGAARNAGWQAARGEYVLFVDADVLLTDAARQFVKQHMAAGADDMAFGLYSPTTPGDNSITRMLITIQRHRFAVEFLKHKYRYGQSSHLLMRRDLYTRLGYFNPHLRMHEDKEICIRAVEAGIAVNVYPEFEAEHTKIFSFLDLMKDHGHKTWLAQEAMEEKPALFQRVKNQLGPGYKATFIGGFVVPVLLLGLVALQLLPILPALLLLIGNLAMPAIFCREVFSEFAFREKCTAVLMWPCMGAVISVGGGLSSLNVRRRRLVRRLDHIAHLARLSWRALRRNGSPIAMIHFITARCNLRCDHCFYKETLDAKDPGEQSLAQIDKTASEIGPLLWYAMAGGEPFIRSDITKIRAIIARRCRPLMLTIPTNGWYTERTFLKTLEMLQEPDAGPLTIQISVDGPEAVHDAIRGEGSWRRLCDTIARLRPLRELNPQLSIGIITVVNEGNAHVYPGFIDELIDRFQPNQVSINLVRPTTLDGPKPTTAVLDAWHTAVTHYEQRIAQGALRRFSYWGGRVVRAKEFVQKNLIWRVARFDEFVTPCTGGNLIYTLWEDGRVSPCELLPETVGNVLDAGIAGDFRRIVRSDKARSVRRSIRDEQCKCTYECAMTVNTMFNPALSMAVGRKLLQDVAG